MRDGQGQVQCASCYTFGLCGAAAVCNTELWYSPHRAKRKLFSLSRFPVALIRCHQPRSCFFARFQLVQQGTTRRAARIVGCTEVLQLSKSRQACSRGRLFQLLQPSGAKPFVRSANFVEHQNASVSSGFGKQAVLQPRSPQGLHQVSSHTHTHTLRSVNLGSQNGGFPMLPFETTDNRSHQARQPQYGLARM